MSNEVIFINSRNVGKTETDRLIHEAAQKIIDLKPRHKGTQPPTLANRPRAKIHAICRSFAISLGELHLPSEVIVSSWDEVEKLVKQRIGAI